MQHPTPALYPTEEGFIQPQPRDELLHPVADSDDHTLSETSYFGFNVPEADISCEIYAWFHPTLKVMSGGVMIFQGYKSIVGQAEYLDYRNVLPYPHTDIDHVHYPCGVKIRVVDPLHHIHITFASPDGATSFAVDCTAIMPAAGRPDAKHFVQAMKCTGELHLDGYRYRIDSYFTRDRSYHLPRSEQPHPVGPTSWMAAVFGDGLAFHCVGSDSDQLSVDALRWGYVWTHGELRAVTAMRKVTHRLPGTIWPTGVELELADSQGNTYHLTGAGRAMLPMPFWPNMLTNLMLTRWEHNQRIGHGDYQDIHFGHTLRHAPTEIDA
jgi:hypothetical protein